MTLFEEINGIIEEELNDFLENNNNPEENILEKYKIFLCLNLGFIKLIDSAQKFSKKDVVEEFSNNCLNDGIDEILLKKSKYVDGEILGFFNYSEFDIDSLTLNEEDFFGNYMEYIRSFDNNITDILINWEILELSVFLSKNNLIFPIIKKLNNIKLKETRYNSQKNLVLTWESYLKEIDKYYNSHDDEQFENPVNKYLIEYLFMNIDIMRREELNLYDPACMDGKSLFLAKHYIERANPKCKVNLFGKEYSSYGVGITKSRMILEGQNPNNIIEIKSYEEQFHDDFDCKFDLIFSNFFVAEKNIYKTTDEDDLGKYIKNYFLDRLAANGKIVLFVYYKFMESLYGILPQIAEKDYLEALIRQRILDEKAATYYIIINKDKIKKHQGKVILIDEAKITMGYKVPDPYVHINTLLNNQKKIFKEYKEVVNSRIFQNQNFRKDFIFTDYMNIKPLKNVAWKFNGEYYGDGMDEFAEFLNEVHKYNLSENPNFASDGVLDVTALRINFEEPVRVKYKLFNVENNNFDYKELKLLLTKDEFSNLHLIMKINNIFRNADELGRYIIMDGLTFLGNNTFEMHLIRGYN